MPIKPVTPSLGVNTDETYQLNTLSFMQPLPLPLGTNVYLLSGKEAIFAYTSVALATTDLNYITFDGRASLDATNGVWKPAVAIRAGYCGWFVKDIVTLQADNVLDNARPPVIKVDTPQPPQDPYYHIYADNAGGGSLTYPDPIYIDSTKTYYLWTNSFLRDFTGTVKFKVGPTNPPDGSTLTMDIVYTNGQAQMTNATFFAFVSGYYYIGFTIQGGTAGQHIDIEKNLRITHN